MTSKLTALAEAAKAATPGPWWKEEGAPRCVYAPVKGGRPNGEGLLTVTYYGTVRPNDTNDATFIALANPTTILELCTLLEKAEEALDKYRGQVDRFGEHTSVEALAAIKQWKELK